MIERRSFLIGAAACFAVNRSVLAASAIPADDKLAFSVVRKGSTIGTHALAFERSATRLIVRVAVDLLVKFGPVPVFRYRHRATETWQNDIVTGIESETNDDGKRYRVSGQRGDAGLMVEGTKAQRYTAPANALPATHWNKHMLDGPMINTEDGRLMHPTVTPMGADRIPTAAGDQIQADRFALTGDVVLDTWYDAQARWTGIRFAAGDGSTIRYERM